MVIPKEIRDAGWYPATPISWDANLDNKLLLTPTQWSAPSDPRPFQLVGAHEVLQSCKERQ